MSKPPAGSTNRDFTGKFQLTMNLSIFTDWHHGP